MTIRLKKDGTPCKKPGRKPDPTKQKPKGPGRNAPRPHIWISGPDEFRHSMYHPWQAAKAQANFREEPWNLSFDEYYELWKDFWHIRGRGPDDVCMTRIDFNGTWEIGNIEIIPRREHWLNQAQYRKSLGLKYRRAK